MIEHTWIGGYIADKETCQLVFLESRSFIFRYYEPRRAEGSYIVAKPKGTCMVISGNE